MSLDLPKKKLFREKNNNEGGENEDDEVLNMISLYELLEKFNGSSSIVNETGSKIKYGIVQLPKYLILHIKRFTKNSYTIEKNGTIVSFPLKNLDMKEYMTGGIKIPSITSLTNLNNNEIKTIAIQYSNNKNIINGIVERDELIRVTTNIINNYTKYDLVANIGHKVSQMLVYFFHYYYCSTTKSMSVVLIAETICIFFSFFFFRSMGQGSNMIRQTNPHDNGMYHSQVYHRMGKQWYSIQDLDVSE